MPGDMKPCPFCGAEPIAKEMITKDNTVRYAVLCINKACYIRPMTNLIAERDEAIKEWNWRKKP